MLVYCSFKSVRTNKYSSTHVDVNGMGELNDYLTAKERLGYKNIGIVPTDDQLYEQWLKEPQKTI